MKPKQIKRKVTKELSRGKCEAGLVLAGFSSIYACRSELRI